MKDLLTLTLPGMSGTPIQVPEDVPVGGLSKANDIFGTGVQTAFIVAIFIALFLMVWSGIQWMTSGGEKEKIVAARKRITYTVIGLLVMVLSVFFVSMIQKFFNLQYFSQSNQARVRQLDIDACVAKGKIGQIGQKGNVTCVDKPTPTSIPAACTQFKTPADCERNGCLFNGTCRAYPDTRR